MTNDSSKETGLAVACNGQIRFIVPCDNIHQLKSMLELLSQEVAIDAQEMIN